MADRTAADYLEAAAAAARLEQARAALDALGPLPPEPAPEPVPILDPGPPPPVDPEVVVQWQGEWTWERGYTRGQLVSWHGATYLALEDNATRTPDENPGIWALVAARGRKGDRGPAGQDGERGPRGWTGAAGASIVTPASSSGSGTGVGDFADWTPDDIAQGASLSYTVESARMLVANKLAMITLHVTFTGTGSADQPLIVTLPSGLTLADHAGAVLGTFVYTQPS